MNTKTDWIKMTDRQPSKADLPVWLHNPSATDGIYTWLWPYTDATPQERRHNFTHWRPAKDDIPAPPREEAQEEMDADALLDWLKTLKCAPTNLDVWRAAIFYERAKTIKILPETPNLYDVSLTPEFYRSAWMAIEAIRARCAGGGK